jgi:hypothetical protein
MPGKPKNTLAWTVPGVYKILVTPYQTAISYPMMNRIVPLLTCLSLAVAATAQAGLISQRSAANDGIAEFNKRMPPKETAISNSVRDAEMTGWDIYRHEALTDIAGYAFSAVVPATHHADIEGSIVIPGTSEWTVRFYGKNERGSYAPMGDVIFDANDRPSVRKDGLAAFNLQELALIKATELVKTQKAACDGVYKNVAILKSDKNIHVYCIRECLDATHVPEGQHVRYIISPDGAKILASREYSRRCNQISTTISAETKSEEVKLTTSLDPQPTEMHIYLSLRYGANIFLATTQSNLYWQINKGVARAD